MLILGLESSCDETAAAVVDDSALVLSDVVQSQVRTHAAHGGIVPELASRDHLRNVSLVVEQALDHAGVSLDAVDAVAVTHRPGLVGALLVGVQAAKGMAWGASKPLVGVDHLLGHLLAVYLRRSPSDGPGPGFPFVALLASGGHTALYRVDGPAVDAIQELGGTRDDAAGEAFDKVGKLLGLGYPGGPIIDRLAANGDPAALPFSIPMARKDSLEFSFSGIKTQVLHWLTRHGLPPNDQAMADMCASFQGAVTRVLSEKLVRAAQQEGISRVVLGGGVAANGELRRRVQQLGEQAGLEVWLPPLASCTDNAAMIAYAGMLRFQRGESDPWNLVATSATSLPRRTRKGRGERL